jgi:hypothetical protein
MSKGQVLTKITVSFFGKMYLDFDRQLRQALLRRDAFIDRMIEVEIPHLREDLAGRSLSDDAHRYVSRTLKRSGGKVHQKSLALDHRTAKALREICTEHNLVRDAFINRLIALLRSTDAFLDLLELPKRVESSRRDGTSDMPTSPLKAIEETQWDPLYYLRSACYARHKCGLHALPMPSQLIGLSCVLHDDQVPGTGAYAEREAREAILPLD